MEDLEHTVRDEVASCIEVSHKELNLQRAVDLLQLESIDQAINFANSREGWKVEGDRITFIHKTQLKQLTKESIPSEFTIDECLKMAIELDRIV